MLRLIEGASACPLDTYDCMQNLTWSDQVQWSTSMAISRRTADVVFSRNNFTILATMNVSAPIAETIAPSDVFTSLEATFGIDSSNPASQYATDPFAVTTQFVEILQNDFQATITNPSAGSALLSLRGILASLLLYFQITWNNPDSNFTSGVLQTGLPPELYVHVDLTQSLQRLTIPKWTWIVYVAISSGIYVWCVSSMVFTLFIVSPPTTSFEVLDFASRIVSNGGDHSFVKLLAETSIGSEKITRNILENKAIFVRAVQLSSGLRRQEGEQEGERGTGTEIGRKIGLAENGLGVEMLSRNVL